MDDHSVASLLARAQSGDTRAFSELVATHRRPMWAVTLRITGNEHDAQDAMQDALVAAWQNLDKFRGDSAIGTWLYRIAANAALAVVRKRREVPVDEVPDYAGGPDIGDRVADRDMVQVALRALPDQFREAIVLREVGDLTYDAIAAHQGVPVATVKTRLNRARKMLLEELTKLRAGA
ncbi:RNA polymerase sigma factor [Smaragdicoccus niigatensis]|uniref:RNA polymerase sigma factor n=1 Tax=Smaragdicoccus niigatensis TaxID=359359 RepID=UPI0003628F53|nr:sigma-70 family RNA polymerase sigma factor [Smaragdicoccus niigatensis]